MTIDKETLIKHRFWIALGVFVVLWLVGVILIPTVQGGNNALVEKKFVDSKRQIEAVNNPKSPEWVKPLQEKEGELKDQKSIVWRQAWEPQKDLMTWPEGGSARLDVTMKDAYFGDEIPPNFRSEYGNKLYQQYVDSLHLSDMVKPVEFDRGWQAIIGPVGEWDVNRTPTVEEIWLAQEDLWVKREMLGIIREALDSVRRFNPVPADKDAKESANAMLLRNANWELNLVLEPDSKNGGTMISTKSSLKNINPWKRTLTLADVPFRIGQGEGNHFDFTVNVDRVAGDETIKFPQAIPFKIKADLAKPLTVEQVLTWQTSPIKRIDRLALGYNSHRTSNRRVKAKPIGKQSEEDKKVETPPPAAGNPMMNTGSGQGMAGSGGRAINKYLQRERYLDFTEQVRWMPVGMVLIVDQQYMQDVQVAVANSRLRIQPTQIAYHRAHGVQSSVVREGKKGTADGGAGHPEMAEGTLGGSSRGQPAKSFPGGGLFPGSGVTSSVSSEEDPNLVELSIYGIASLYERFPPKAPVAAPKP